MANMINFEKFYDIFRDISRIVHASVDLQEVLELVVWKSAEMFGASSAFLRIINLKTQQTERSAAIGLDDAHLARNPLNDPTFIKALHACRKAAVVTNVADTKMKTREYLQEKGI